MRTSRNINIQLLLFCIGIAISSLTSCSERPDEPSITKDIIITDTVSYLSCISPQYDDSIYVALTDSAYKSWNINNTNCKAPAIDFTKRCVIMFRVTTGSDVDYRLTASRNDETKKVTVLVRYIQYGSQNNADYKDGFYSLPKIPEGYSLETQLQWMGIHDGARSATELLSSGTREDLNDVVVVDTTTAYVVGMGGTILKTTDMGRSWVAQQSGVTGTLRSVWACSPQSVYAVGEQGIMLRTRNGGASWERMGHGVSGAQFRDIRIYRDSIGVAVGMQVSEDGVQSGLIVRTSDGGRSWQKYNPSAGVALPILNCLAAYSDEAMYNTSTTLNMGLFAAGKKINNSPSNILTSTDNGITWISNGNGTPYEIFGIGLGRHVLCYGGGKDIWEDSKSIPTGVFIPSMIFPNIVTGNIRSAHGNRLGGGYGPVLVGENGFIMETFMGIGWYAISSGTTETLNGVHWIFTNSNSQFWRLAVGNKGTIVRIYKERVRWLQ